jgi:glycosyltransferase involved in cell wall biosynthesis
MRSYRDHIVQRLVLQGAEFIPIADQQDLTDHEVDLYWDPGCGGGSPPTALFRHIRKPGIATLHGAGVFALPLKTLHPNLMSAIRHKLSTYSRLYRWRHYRDGNWTFITVSHFAELELRRHLALQNQDIIPIHHGLDHSEFYPVPAAGSHKPYFLHVSQYKPKKNVGRIIEAYHRLRMQNEIRLIIVSPESPLRDDDYGVEIVRDMQSHPELAYRYQNALAFLFPSLHETFGMPILEAMACGCPVITSNISACPEVAGDAALLVDPYSVESLTAAMRRLVEQPDLRADLREKGVQRAAMFSWGKCADQHLQVFQDTLNRSLA